MEKRPDIKPNIENMSRPPMADTPNNEAPEEANPVIETEHNGNKVYVCTDCNKAFKYQSQANRHSIVHKKDRPYPCTFKGCNKSFKRADILETHMQRHTDNLLYACDEPGCDQKFATKQALQYHQVKHANQHVYKREVEDGIVKMFLQVAQRKQHLPPEGTPEEEEEECPLDPATEKEYQQLLAAPYNRTQWKVLHEIKEKQKTPEDQEQHRIFFNYIINQMRTLKELARKLKEARKPLEDNNTDFPDSISQKSFSEFARFTEQLGKDDFKLIGFIKESPDNTG